MWWRISLLSSLLLVPLSADAALTLSTSGNRIYWSAGGGACCVGATIDEPWVPGNASCSAATCSTLPDRGSFFDCNSVGTHAVEACWYSFGVPRQCETGFITVTTPPPLTCPVFEMRMGTQVVTSRPVAADDYPYGQTADAQMTVRIIPKRSNPGDKVYLRVVDPPGSAAYGQPRVKDDNADTTQNVGTFSGSKTTSVDLPDAGSVPVVLTTTGYAAGDNYEVLASTDPTLETNPDFVCDTTQGCRRITATAWKRAYLETDRMFRKGAMFVQNAQPGATVLYLNDVSMFRAKKGSTPGSTIRLVHANRAGIPARFEPGNNEPTITVNAIDKNNKTITLSRAIYGTYLKADSTAQPWLADGVGVLTGDDVVDYFPPNTNFATSIMYESFVDLRGAARPSTDCACLPYYANFTDPLVNDLREMSARWNSHEGEPNHFYVAGANLGGDELGERIVGTRNAFAFVSKINSWTFINEPNFNGEVVAHEFTHAWDVNGLGGHCEKNDFENASLKCLMRPGAYWVVNGSPAAEYYDGRVKYHFDATLPEGAPGKSEYYDVCRHQVIK